MHAKKTAFIVEHDFIMAAYLADRVIVYEGEASVNAIARAPQSLLTGISQALHHWHLFSSQSANLYCFDTQDRLTLVVLWSIC